MKSSVVTLGLCCLVVLSGCLNYHSEREFGNYYDSTKKIWHEPFRHHDAWFGEAGSLGQTIGFSGMFMFVYGLFVTAPVGFAIHQVEKVTLSPVVDTLYLPADLYYRSSYLDKCEKWAAEVAARQKRYEEERKILEAQREERRRENERLRAEKMKRR